MGSKLTFPTMVSFGTGQVSEAIKNAGFNVFLLFINRAYYKKWIDNLTISSNCGGIIFSIYF